MILCETKEISSCKSAINVIIVGKEMFYVFLRFIV